MTEQRNGGNQGVCLAPETLAAYLDNRLTDAERSDVEAHLANCDDCRELLVETFHANAALNDEGVAAVEGEMARTAEAAAGREPAREAIPPAGRETGPETARVLQWRRRVWTVSGGLLAAVAAVVLIVRLDPEWYRVLRGGARGVAPLHTELVEAVGERRYVEGRLTGGFAYGPAPSVTRSAAAGRRLPPDVQIAILHIEGAAEQDTSPSLRHALGVAKLIGGDADAAIAVLEPLARAETVQPRVLTDLAAAHLARARDRGDQQDVSRALDAARHAVAADASLAEAWFNLALAREAAGETDQAREAWRRYLALDKSSAWRAEAERHLQTPRR